VVSVIPLEVCDDEVDNDEDSLVDCEDPDCSGPGCQEVCDDVMDNDGDSFADCADTDCPACPEICTNGLDDNRNDLVDCDDSDCATDAACTEATTPVTETSEGGCGCAVFGTSTANPLIRFVVPVLTYLLPVAFIAFQRRRLRSRSKR